MFSLVVFVCSAQSLDDDANTAPRFDVEHYFKGPLQAQGVVLDRGGEVTRRFTVEMLGTWQGNKAHYRKSLSLMMAKKAHVLGK